MKLNIKVFQIVALAIALAISTLHANASEFRLDFDTWKLISIATTLPEGLDTPMAAFGDEIAAMDPLALYEKDWIMYSYDALTGDYNIVGETESLSPDTGYWIIQAVASDITVEVDDDIGSSLLAELGCAPDELIKSTPTGWDCIPETSVEGSTGPEGPIGPQGPAGPSGPVVTSISLCATGFSSFGFDGRAACASRCGGLSKVIVGQTGSVTSGVPFRVASCEVMSDNGSCEVTATSSTNSPKAVLCCSCRP